MRSSVAPPLDPAAYAFTHQVRVRFAETDAMGVVHHAAYLPYLEAARVEWLRELGYPYTRLRDEGIDFAVVEIQVRYRTPARFDDVIEVHLGIASRRRSSFEIGYLLTVDGRPIATASSSHAAVTAAGRPTRLPAWLLELDTPLISGSSAASGADPQGSSAAAD